MANALQVDFLNAGVFDNGTPLAAGKVYTTDAGSGDKETSQRTTWTDAGKTTPSANPIVLDADGRAEVYADGNYKFWIYDVDDNLFTTIDNQYYNIPETLSTVVSVDVKTTSFTASAAEEVLLCNASSGAIVCTLPTSSEGKIYRVKKTDAGANTVTLDPTSTETIDGALTVVLANQYDEIVIIGDGTNWQEFTGFSMNKDRTITGDLVLSGANEQSGAFEISGDLTISGDIQANATFINEAGILVEETDETARNGIRMDVDEKITVGDTNNELVLEHNGTFTLSPDGAIDGEDLLDITAGAHYFPYRDAEQTETATSYTKAWESKVARNGTYRVRFKLKSGESTFIAYGRIYKNGSPEGAERTNATTSYVAYTEDVALVSGDLIQLYVKAWTTKECLTTDFALGIVEVVDVPCSLEINVA